MTKQYGALLTATFVALFASAVPNFGAAQESSGRAEYWSSSYERFQRTQHSLSPAQDAASATGLIGPPGILICDPQALGGGARARGTVEAGDISADGVITSAFGHSRY